MDKHLRSLNVGCGNDFDCTDRIDMYPTKATTKVGDLNKKLPYPDNYFSYIKAKCVLEHLRNPGFFIDECYRVLKKDGHIYVRTDHAGFLPAYLFDSHEHNKVLEVQYQQGFGHPQNEDHHYALFVESHLRYLFNKFKNIKFGYFYGGKNKLYNLILRMFPKHTGACHIELRATK
jgi:SAM-dependent methyltransferase